MLAAQLQSILCRLMPDLDSASDLQQRFRSLGACGLIPKGEKMNSRHLTSREIALCILSIAQQRPTSAGFTSIIVDDLKPVGGINKSFQNSECLGSAVEIVLCSETALDSFVQLRIIECIRRDEIIVYAALDYSDSTDLCTSYYVSKMALSLLHPGEGSKAFRGFPGCMITRDTIIHKNFLSSLTREIERSTQAQPYLCVDDEEQKENARAARLQIGPRSRFLNIGVDTQVCWPAEETLVTFEGYRLVMMPKQGYNTTSIHIDLGYQNIDQLQARTIINRFLSVLAWCSDQYCILQEGWSGNPVPVPVSRRDLAFSTAVYWRFLRAMPNSDDARKALAIYREGRNAEQNFLVSYAVLSYYKIIEIKHKNATRSWLRDNYEQEKSIGISQEDVARLETDCRDKIPGNYLHDACRCAVAHANNPYSTDPDSSDEIRRLDIAARILRVLARRFIREELGVSDSLFDGS